MSFQLPQPSDNSERAKKKGASVVAKETDPLIRASRSGGSLRARRSSKSPVDHAHFTPQGRTMIGVNTDDSYNGDQDGYESIESASLHRRQPLQQTVLQDDEESNYLYPPDSAGSVTSTRPDVPLQQAGGIQGVQSSESASVGSGSQPPLLEIPEEIYAVRKAALKVLKPLTKTWVRVVIGLLGGRTNGGHTDYAVLTHILLVPLLMHFQVVISVGFALTVLFGMSRWTRLLPGLPFWFILFPCWASHIGLLWLHVLSARALSSFIAEANDSRQRPDSRDHLNRTEYLPLLQRSLKFGLKTGLLSFCVFIFEILLYVRLARGSISLSWVLCPLWLLVTCGIVDGLICKTQHFLRVICWILTFSAMVLTVMKVDHGFDDVRWRFVFSPVLAVLAIASASLVYIVYGHQIGYYRLTESQLTAGNLYSLAALICIVLIVVIGEVIPLTRPVEVETRLFVVVLAPLVVCLVGMAAWVVSRDEFGRLLLYGGQSAVHPMKLRWEAKGWASIQGRGVTVIPMFGEVSFQPLERKPTDRGVAMCARFPGGCYPYEELHDEETTFLTGDFRQHPYLDASSTRSGKKSTNRTA
jgi:hypothetical protein